MFHYGRSVYHLSSGLSEVEDKNGGAPGGQSRTHAALRERRRSAEAGDRQRPFRRGGCAARRAGIVGHAGGVAHDPAPRDRRPRRRRRARPSPWRGHVRAPQSPACRAAALAPDELHRGYAASGADRLVAGYRAGNVPADARGIDDARYRPQRDGVPPRPAPARRRRADGDRARCGAASLPRRRGAGRRTRSTPPCKRPAFGRCARFSACARW